MSYGISDWTAPVANAKITSGAGPRKSFRTNNGKMSSSFHHGLDIVGDKNIKNATTGVVTFAGHINGYGNTVVVKNPQGYYVQYAHLASINVSKGQNVKAGEQIGIMGSTGNSTGVHLDLIVVKDGKSIKPDGSVNGTYQKSWLNGGSGSAPVQNNTPTGTDTNTFVNDLISRLTPKVSEVIQANLPKETKDAQTTADTGQSTPELFSGVSNSGVTIGGGLSGANIKQSLSLGGISAPVNSIGANIMLQSANSPQADFNPIMVDLFTGGI